MKMEFWFLSHPLAGTQEQIKKNLEKNAALARELALRHPDRVIFSPLAAASFLQEPDDREIGMRYCLAFLGSGIFTGIILPSPEWVESEGCRKEFAEAWKRKIKIEFVDSKSREVYQIAEQK